MTAISNNDIAQAIYLASKEKGGEDHFSAKVVKFLEKRRFLSKAPSILSHLNKIINEHEGRVVAKVSSADKINEKMKKELTATLAHRYKAKEIRIVENLDKRLLGGIKIEVNDEVIDLTMKNKIERLQEHLTKPL
ncbi:MAG: ATP synthase F1 subunit delta [Candidatus Paceibacterota bacterium]|jgi:F-type H+-transporting ATPase subunit delta